MKKISFGSFPFINVDKKTRFCLDKYLIKKFADQIIITDIFRNLNSAKDFFYLTPEVIIDQLYDFENRAIRKNNFEYGIKTRGYYESEEIEEKSYTKYNEMTFIFEDEKIKTFTGFKYIEAPKEIIEEMAASSSKSSGKTKDSSDKSTKTYSKTKNYSDPYFNLIKRAFFITRKFYERIQNDPFYKDIVVLPVYSEKLETINKIDLNKSQYNYSFFILTNDLLNDLKLDEVVFNEAEVINTLYIFINVFPEKSLTDFNQNDLDVVLKLYNYFETNNISPISFFVAIDYLIYLFQDVNSFNDLQKKLQESKVDFNIKIAFDYQILNEMYNYFQQLSAKSRLELFKELKFATDLKRNGVLISSSMKFTDFFSKKASIRISPSVKQQIIKNLIELFTKNKDLNSLFKVTAKTISERYQILNQRIKYKNIILLFQELVKFNSKKFNDIIKDANLELNFKIELKQEKIAYNEQLLKRKLDESFANFIRDADAFLVKIKKELEKNNKIQPQVRTQTSSEEAMQIREIQRQLKEIKNEIINIQNDPNIDNMTKNNMINNLQIRQNQLENQLIQLQLMINSVDLQSQYAGGRINPTNRSALDGGSVVIDERVKMIQNELKRVQDQIDIYVTKGEPIPDNLAQEELRLKDELYTILNQFDFDTKVKSVFNSAKFELSEVKTELADLYQRAKSLLTTEGGLQLFLDNPIETTDDYYKILTYNGSSEDLIHLKEYIYDIDEAIKDITSAILINFEDAIKAKELTLEHNSSVMTKFKMLFTDLHEKYFDTIYSRLVKIFVLRVFKVFAHGVKKMIENKEIQYKEVVSGIHPLLAKLLKNPDNFKSFIFGFDMLLVLYDLDYKTKLRKFIIGAAGNTAGVMQSMPTKYNQPSNQIDYVITDLLKLENNPIWIISKSKIYLSLPDYLALLKQRVFSNIPRDKIYSYCKIDFRKIWGENKMGFALAKNSKQEIIKKIETLSKTLKEIEKKIKNKEDEKSKNKKNKSKKQQIEKELRELRTERDSLITVLKYWKGQLALYDEKTALDLLSIESDF